jgi:hypothetical protein
MTIAIVKIFNSLLLLFTLINRNEEYYRRIRLIIYLGAVIFILFISLRVDGPDLYIHKQQFNHPDRVYIFDKGYIELNRIAAAIFPDFRYVTLLISLTSILAIYKSAKYFNVNYQHATLFYLIHLMVLRDFVQLRFGLATSIFLISLTINNFYLRIITYLISISIHASVIILVIILEILRIWQKKRKLLTFLLVPCIFLLAANVQYFFFLDPRVMAYLNWKVEARSTSSHLTYLVFQLTLFSLFYINRGFSEIINLNLYLSIFGLTLYLAFWDLTYIQGRIAGIFFTLYPLALSSIFSKQTRIDKGITGILTLAILFSIILRPDFKEIFQLMSWL